MTPEVMEKIRDLMAQDVKLLELIGKQNAMSSQMFAAMKMQQQAIKDLLELVGALGERIEALTHVHH